MPKVSFVCSVHNAGKYLEPFLRSILLQDYKDYESIFIDAGSNDGSREILKKYATKHQDFQLIEEKLIAIAKAVNIGIKQAQGEYIARIDADNILFPSFLSDQVDYLDKHPDIDFVIADQLKINADNKLLGMLPFLITDKAMKKHLLFKTAIGGAPMLGRKKAFFDVGLYEETTEITEDRIFALKAMKTKRFASINKINYVYRIHEQAITRRYKRSREHLAKVKEYESKYINKEDYVSDPEDFTDILKKELNYKELILKKIANTCLHCALYLADQGQKDMGLKELKFASRLYPKNKMIYSFFAWLIKVNKKDLAGFSEKFNYWLPFKIDLMQLVPLRSWEKSFASPVDKKLYLDIVKEYKDLLKKVQA